MTEEETAAYYKKTYAAHYYQTNRVAIEGKRRRKREADPNAKKRLPALDISKYNIDQANERLKCSHNIGSHAFNYTMPCILLYQTKAGKWKIVVFGDRWKNKEHVKKVRYVWPYQIKGKVTSDERCSRII